MYQIIASDDFIEVIKELPLRNIHVLTKSFLSIKKMLDEEVEQDQTFLKDLLSQVKNQELE